MAASSTPIVLGILARGESYGYEMIQQVRALSGGDLEWTDGMLYPVLHRLESRGLIQSTWRVAESGRRRKYYRLESRGKTVLETQRQEWRTMHATLSRIWRAAHV